MNHIAAALLVTLSGKKIEMKSIEDVLNAAGSKVNSVIVNNIIEATKGKSPEDIIKAGLPKLAVASGVSVGGGAEVKGEDKKEEKKDDKKGGDKKGADKKPADKKKEEKKKVDDDEDDMPMGLF